MDSATTSAQPIDRRGAGRGCRDGFTLTEVLIAAALTSFVLAGVLGVFLFIGQTGFRAGSYSETETEVRRGLETFAEDSRQASDIHWNSGQSLTLTLPVAGGGSAQCTYAYDTDPTSPTYQCLYRMPGDAASGQPRSVLVHGVAPDFAFQRFKLVQPEVTDNTASNDLETKQIQLVLRTVRRNIATTGASQAAISARFILRNKRVSN